MIKNIKSIFTITISVLGVCFIFLPESFFEVYKLFPEHSNWINILVNRILFFMVIFLFLFLYKKYLQKKITVNGEYYKIQIEYGNIFDIDNAKKIIAFDECFISTIGENPQDIKSESVCGQYLTRNPNLDISKIIADSDLKTLKSKSNYNKKEKYESGRVIINDDYILMAFAKLDKAGKGCLTREEFLDSLSILWKEIHKYCAYTDVCMPILGSGVTRVGDSSLTQQDLLDLIITSYQLSVYKIKLPYKLRIVCKKTTNFSLNKIGSL